MRKHLILAALLAAFAGGGPVLSQDAPPGPIPAADAIAARKALMEGMEALLSQLEADQANALLGPEQMVSSTSAIAAQMDAFPLLFPQASNLLGGAAAIEGVATSADPKVWTQYADFLALAEASATAARGGTEARPAAALPALRATCDACHAQYLQYDPFAAMGQ